MFIQKGTPNTKVEYTKSLVPVVIISAKALAKMQIYVEECNDEIGWLGTAYQSGKNYIISDVLLFEQEVHSTTTEISPEGLATFAEELLEQEDGIETWNSIRLWGHSHVNMDVTPSSQDDKQMDTFAQCSDDFFIRIIANKKGDMKIDLYLFELGITYIDVPWIAEISKEENDLQTKIKVLEEAILKIKSIPVLKIKDAIKTEMTNKVRKKAYVYNYVKPAVGFQQSYINHQSSYADWEDCPFKTPQIDKKKIETQEVEGLINEYADIFLFFDTNEIEEFAYCLSAEEVGKIVSDILLSGADDFSGKDIQNLYDFSRDYENRKGAL